MAVATHLGFPRIGRDRELKRALESFWSGKISEEQLLTVGRELRRRHWRLQQALGIEQIPSNDFSLYDHVLDTCAMVGAIPERYGSDRSQIDLKTYFAMARGGENLTAMEMTKWFDTNYHYLVPEFTSKQAFHFASTKIVDEFREAKDLGILTRPVLLGPVSFLLLGKSKEKKMAPLHLLPNLLPVYGEMVNRLSQEGADWIQIDEPCFVLDRTPAELQAFREAYSYLSKKKGQMKFLLTSYFEAYRENLKTVLSLPVEGIHLDLVRGKGDLDSILRSLPENWVLSLGVVDGRNIWRNRLRESLTLLERVIEKIGSERIFVAPSCSLLHVPIDLDLETSLDTEMKSWMAFAKQKLQEIVALTRALNEGLEKVQPLFEEADQAEQSRKQSGRVLKPRVRKQLQKITLEMLQRCSPYSTRKKAQRSLKLPIFPTTTIGSFPQTPEVRAARADFKAGRITLSEYEIFLENEIRKAVRFQEQMQMDILVHGEFERNDMVEYFGERLEGFAFTQNGWVQSYGSRCVKPPILYGDIVRPKPMTIRWAQFAQSLTSKPMKGMLTGPITILEWSFVRDDQPRWETARQIAWAIRQEALDLEKAGLRVIQIDEPAFREALPLRRSDWPGYFKWAAECFRLASSSVKDETQIHTHMCYAEFNDILPALAEMDVDVISIESSRSPMELLESFQKFKYRSGIGPGIYDIHSPRVPLADEMVGLLRRAVQVIPEGQIWVNPDCGLKTRKWGEVLPSLRNMVLSAQVMRLQFAKLRRKKR
ncbi:MAG: 5-methyltetrahydropteroyltriglutamate--homocysteine S-methyltransferase [Deltaproteobacteria bacterium]|nr:5-methyltetrahydropteroyltriglutamate--homocysteine S-methyltransferase [Deltaproteobacteria bacterium]